MPVFDFEVEESIDNVSLDNDQIDLSYPVEDENRVLDQVLQTESELDRSELRKLVGAKTPVQYFRQVSVKGNNYIQNGGSFNDIDPQTITFDRINKAFIILEGAVDTSSEEEDEGLGLKSSGSAFVPPDTIQPTPGDYFIMDIYGQTNLYKIVGIESKSRIGDGSITFSYELEGEDYDFETNEEYPLKDCIRDEYFLEYSHTGVASYKTIFRKDEYETLHKMKNIYGELAEEYIDQFFDKLSNTIFCPSDRVPKQQTFNISGVHPPEYWSEGQETDIKMPSTDLYDSVLVHFMNENNIFNRNGDTIIRFTQYVKCDPRAYKKTVYSALENRSINSLRDGYFTAISINTLSYSIASMMYDKSVLSYVPILNEDSFELYPTSFLSRFKSRKSPYAISETLDDTLEEFITKLTINFVKFFNDKDFDKSAWVDTLYSRYNDKLHIDMLDRRKGSYFFYLYPILGYLLKVMIRDYSLKLENK